MGEGRQARPAHHHCRLVSPRATQSLPVSSADIYVAALVWILFYSEFEWWGQKYKPSEEVSPFIEHRGGHFADDSTDPTKDELPLRSARPGKAIRATKGRASPAST